MEIKKQVLHVLSIGLMLSVISPVYAAFKPLARVKLYRKCIARKCNEEEKMQVRADAMKGAKVTAALGALLAAAVVAIGVATKKSAWEDVVYKKHDIVFDDCPKWEQNLLVIFKKLGEGTWSESQVLNELNRENVQDRQGGWVSLHDATLSRSILSAAAELYYQHELRGDDFSQFLNKFNLKITL